MKLVFDNMQYDVMYLVNASLDHIDIYSVKEKKWVNSPRSDDIRIKGFTSGKWIILHNQFILKETYQDNAHWYHRNHHGIDYNVEQDFYHLRDMK